MDKSLTIVLPLHNAERTLPGDVRSVLEVAAELTPRVEILLLDNGSDDDTFESAAELATRYPQVRVVHRPRRDGLADALRQIRSGIASDVVIVHDGSSRIHAEQLRGVWLQQQALAGAAPDRAGVSFADLRRPAATQPIMERVHRRLMGFRGMAPDRGASAPADGVIERLDAPTAGEPTAPARSGVGAIPPLPAMRPGVFGALSDFARGE